MCQTQTIAYSCSHSLAFRLSTCGARFTYLTRKRHEKRASCSSASLITRRSEAICGACARAKRETELDEEVAELKRKLIPGDEHCTAETPQEVSFAEGKRQQELYLMEKTFPSGFKKSTRPEKGPGSTWRSGRESLLKNEVRPEEVVLRYEVNKWATSGGWDFGDNYQKLEDEVAENLAAQDAARITVSWAPWAGQDEDEHESCETQLEVGCGVLKKETENTMDNGVEMSYEWSGSVQDVEKSIQADDSSRQVENLAVDESLSTREAVAITPKEDSYPESMFSELRVFLDAEEKKSKTEETVLETKHIMVNTAPGIREDTTASKENELPTPWRGTSLAKPPSVQKKQAYEDLRSLRVCSTFGMGLTTVDI